MRAGYWIWQIKKTFGGDPIRIAAELKARGATDALIKMADGGYLYNLDPVTKADLVPALVTACRALGIRVWGWQYNYTGSDYELLAAEKRIDGLDLDGWVLDVEGEWKVPGMDKKAEAFLKKFRAKFPDLELGFSSFRFPRYHQEFPWKVFAAYCDINMPQVYWEKAHNAGHQLREALVDHNKFVGASLDFYPVGAAYNVGQWRPTVADVVDFNQTAEQLKLGMISYWSWDELNTRTGELLEPISQFYLARIPAPETNPRLDTLEARVKRLGEEALLLAGEISALRKALGV